MSTTNLNSEQLNLKKELEEYLAELKKDSTHGELKQSKKMIIYDEMGLAAHKLHMSLKNQGVEPVHHRYMIKNRGMDPTNINFYRHIHPVEDLLAFLDDVHRNDDPADRTLNSIFYMNIYSRRWGHTDKYKLVRNEEGWYVSFNSSDGQCDKDGNKILFESLNNDSVNFPSELPGYLEWTWEQAAEEGLSEIEIQNALNDLSDWINLCEKNSPKGIYRGFK